MFDRIPIIPQVSNTTGLHKVQNKTFYHSMEQIFDRVLNMRLVLKGTLMQIWKSPYMFVFT